MDGRPALVGCGAVALPLVVTSIRLAAAGWVPVSDDAFMATRAFDVLTTDSPLVGMYSSAVTVSGPDAFHPGPSAFWLLALPARLLPEAVLPVVVALFAAGCLAGAVWCAHRLVGPWFAGATAVGVVLLERALGLFELSDVWNPWIALAPLVLLCLVAWRVLAGEAKLLPLVALTASFVAQAHLAYVPIAVLLGVASSAAALATKESRRGTVLATGSVLALVWAAPLVQQLTTDPGNLTVLADANEPGRPRLGGRAALSAVVRTAGLPPAPARARLDDLAAVTEATTPASPLDLAAGAVVLGGLAAATYVAVRKRHRVLWAGAAVAGCGLAAVAAQTWVMPADRPVQLAYTTRWLAVVGLVVWLVIVAAVPKVRDAIVGRVAVAAAAVAAAAAVLVAATTPALDHPLVAYFEPAGTLGDALLDATEPGGSYLVDDPGPVDIVMGEALVWQLRRAGRHPVVADAELVDAFGDRYAPTGSRCAGVLVLVEPDTTVAPAGGDLVASVESPEAFELRTLELRLVPDTAEPSC